jgi:Ricin-type beta-trefoil lectin domain-like
MNRTEPRYVSVDMKNAKRLFSLMGVVCMAVVLTGAPAKAGLESITMLRSWPTGECIDSNRAGQAYTLSCNFGGFQRWFLMPVAPGSEPERWGDYGRGPVVYIRNMETGLVLDSDHGGHVYTNPHLDFGNQHQQWIMTGDDNITQFQNVATGKCLTTGTYGDLHTNKCGWDHQYWRQGF